MENLQTGATFSLSIKEGIPLVKINVKYLDLTFARALTEILKQAAAQTIEKITAHQAVEKTTANQATLLDFKDVTYIDSVIISTIVKHFVDQRNKGRRLVIFNTGKLIDDLLETTRLKDILDITEEMDQGIALAKQPLTDKELSTYGRKNNETVT